MWKQYWIYFKGETDEDYFKLLNDVVIPTIWYSYALREIEKFFFFRYLHDGMHYIRLRVKGTELAHSRIVRDLDSHIQSGNIIKHEDSDYNEVEDIAGRFGETWYQDIIDMCETASKLALNYASGNEVYDPHPQQVGGVAGIIHLIANTLNFYVELDKKYEVNDWNRKQNREGRTP